jgi:hypothetical protein
VADSNFAVDDVFTRGVTSGCGKRLDQSARRNLRAQE